MIGHWHLRGFGLFSVIMRVNDQLMGFIRNWWPMLRYVAIFSYVEQPDMVGAPERTKQLYGRVLPIHLKRAGLRGDSFID